MLKIVPYFMGQITLTATFIMLRYFTLTFVVISGDLWCFVAVQSGSVMVVCGGFVVVLWWFVVVRGGSVMVVLWWFSCGGFVVALWWFVVVLWWFVVVCGGFLWWFCGGL